MLDSGSMEASAEARALTDQADQWVTQYRQCVEAGRGAGDIDCKRWGLPSGQFQGEVDRCVLPAVTERVAEQNVDADLSSQIPQTLHFHEIFISAQVIQ